MSVSTPTTANEFLEQQIDNRLQAIEDIFESDAICIIGPMYEPVADLVRVMIEDRRHRVDSRAPRATVLITTGGGTVEAVQRIVETIRYHYDFVNFVIPRVAYSAGTVLALSGNEIYMDYYARLGPIDPQVMTHSGRWVSALGYVRKWEALVEKSTHGTLSAAEFQMLATFDAAELFSFEQARELAITLLGRWLSEYKFSTWQVTETTGKCVDDEMRKERAQQIARALSDPDRWHSHGHGISRAVLDEELQLRINDLDADSDRLRTVRDYDSLLVDYMMKMGFGGMIHVPGRYRPMLEDPGA